MITYELKGNVALIGLNRPEKRNALSEELIAHLREAVVRAGEEADAGLLFGHGPNFSAGLDLAEYAKRIDPKTVRPRKRQPNSWHVTFDLISRGTIPFVAALHGPTIGGGLELASAAHVRVADETAVFGLPEAQRGIFVGGGGSVRIQRLIGYAAMADMMLTGRMLSAQEALAARLVQYAVPAGDAYDRGLALAERIAQNTAQTNWQICNVLPRINDLSHDDGLFMEYLNMSMVKPPEAHERLRDFVEKRAAPLDVAAAKPKKKA